jgi:hypothetical protein
MVGVIVLLAQTLLSVPVMTIPAADAPADLQHARVEAQSDGRAVFVADLQSQTGTPLTKCGVRLYRVSAMGIPRQTFSQLLSVDLPAGGRTDLSMSLTNFSLEAGDRLVAVLMIADGWKLDGEQAHDLVLRAISK